MRIICIIATLALALSWALPASAADPRLQKFLTQFTEFKAQTRPRSAWLGPGSPFAPYLDKPFIDGLGERGRVLYGHAYSQGACRMARTVATVGFLNHYPFLASAFDRTEIRAAFEVYILPKLDKDPYPCIPAEQDRDEPDRPLPPLIPDLRHG